MADWCWRCNSKTSTFFVCTSCQAFFEQPLGKMVTKTSETSGQTTSIFRTQAGPLVPDKCTECDSVLHVSEWMLQWHFDSSIKGPQIAGPMWSGQLHDPDFVGKVLKHLESSKDRYGTAARMKGMLTVAQEVRIVLLIFCLICSQCAGTSNTFLFHSQQSRQSFPLYNSVLGRYGVSRFSTHRILLIAYMVIKGLHFLMPAIVYLVPMLARVPWRQMLHIENCMTYSGLGWSFTPSKQVIYLKNRRLIVYWRKNQRMVP